MDWENNGKNVFYQLTAYWGVGRRKEINIYQSDVSPFSRVIEEI